MLVDFVTQFLSILTFIGGIFIGISLINFIIHKKRLRIKLIEDNSLLFAFIVALIATLGSLFYSEIAGYTPCKLCWYQRIFMYPQSILLGIALFKKFKNIFYYVVPLSIIGGIISIYHYIIQRMSYVSSCAADGVSCTFKYVFHFGYITIPMMALTAFCLIIILTYSWKKQ